MLRTSLEKETSANKMDELKMELVYPVLANTQCVRFSYQYIHMPNVGKCFSKRKRDEIQETDEMQYNERERPERKKVNDDRRKKR